MRVILEVYGELRRFLQNEQRRLEMEVEDNVTVADLLKKVGIDLMEPWNASLNGTLADPSDTVTEGSVLIVFPPISGG